MGKFEEMPAFVAKTSFVGQGQERGLRRVCQAGGRVSESRRRPARIEARRQGDESEDNSKKDARVDPNSNVSLKKQLWLVKETARRSSSGKAVERTSFRKKKEKTKTSSNGIDDSDEYVKVPKGKYNKNHPPIMFIDGYNVIGFWPKLRKKRDKNDLKGARDGLNAEVRGYSGLRGWTCVVVYDAMQSERRGLSVTEEDGITIAFTGDDTADSYIEKRTKECVDANDRQVWAATSDYLQQKMAYGNGAHIMSASLFVQEIKRTSKEASHRLAKHNKQMDTDRIGLLKHALSDEQKKKLLDTFGGDELRF